MKLHINGEIRTFDAPVSVLEVLRAMNLPSQKIAVELNLEIVPKSAYESQMVAEGDRLSLIHI